MKAPAFQWYVKDSMTDEFIRRLTLEEFGFYIKCLEAAWINDGLPERVEEIADTLLIHVRLVQRMWPKVSPKFQLISGRYRNPKQEDQRKQNQEYRESRRRNGKARWDMHMHSRESEVMHSSASASASAIKNNTDNLATLSPSDAVAPNGGISISSSTVTVAPLAVKPTSPVTTNTQRFELKFNLDAISERMYERHPKKKGKPLAQQAIVELARRVVMRSQDAEQFFERVEAAHIECCRREDWLKSNGQYAPPLAVWIADEGYTGTQAWKARAAPEKPKQPPKTIYNGFFPELHGLPPREAS